MKKFKKRCKAMDKNGSCQIAGCGDCIINPHLYKFPKKQRIRGVMR